MRREDDYGPFARERAYRRRRRPWTPTGDTGIITLASPGVRSSVLFPLFQFRADCEDGEVCSIFFSMAPTGPYPNPTTAQLIVQLDWQYKLATGQVLFDLLQGTIVRIPCNLAVARVLYTGAGPGFTVWAARVEDVTNAPPIQLTQYVDLPALSTSTFFPVPPYAKTIRLTSTQVPRNNEISFWAGDNFGSLIASEGVITSEDMPIPGGAAFFTITNIDGNTQVVSAICTIQL